MVTVRIFQHVCNRCGPGSDGIPIPKVAEWFFNKAFDRPLFDEVYLGRVNVAVKDSNVTGLDAIGNGLQSGWQTPTLQQLKRIPHPGRSA